MAGEVFQTLALENSFGLVAKEDGIAVEGYPDFIGIIVLVLRAGEQCGAGISVLKSQADILGIGREKEVGLKGGQIYIGRAAAGKDSPGYVDSMFLDGVEHPETGIDIVLGHQDDLHRPLACLGILQGQKPPYQGEGHPWQQAVPFMFNLVQICPLEPSSSKIGYSLQGQGAREDMAMTNLSSSD